MMGIKVFTHPEFIRACDKETYSKLVSRFTEYKNTGVRHPTFGRDADYDRPFSVKSAELQHIHIEDGTSKNWHLKKMDFYSKTSNTALVYCEGYYKKDHFLLLSLLENAHDYYTGGQHYLCQLAELAEKFRSKY